MLEILIPIANLVILESLLSVDNAAVLAVMVQRLPEHQRTKALRYGLFGAYLFRGICLFLASFIMKFMWLKIAGGLYLMYLVYDHFKSKADDGGDDSAQGSKVFEWARTKLGLSYFWSTIVLVEVMDLAFSIDNVFAAVALSKNFWVIMTGVAIGILAMRFVAGWFVKLITKYPSLETSAFIVIAILGLKLIITGTMSYIPSMHDALAAVESHMVDLLFSGAMMLIFFVPLLLNKARKPAL